jgi:seryl-tRNA synthetase
MDPHADGVYGRRTLFERVLVGLSEAISNLDVSAKPEVLRFPPVISRETIRRAGYFESFPHLLGTIHSFAGDERTHSPMPQPGDSAWQWREHDALSDVVLTPAACYAVYPHATGTLPAEGRVIDIESWCFRQEPSDEPERMRAFRMREFVRIGSAAEVQAWRSEWIPRAQEFLTQLGLRPDLALANDPFFGTGARFLAMSQREQELKFELSVQVRAGAAAACISCNYHLDHFGTAFEIQTNNGQPAYTACVAFGLERLTLGLFAAHGPSLESWPRRPLRLLGLSRG